MATAAESVQFSNISATTAAFTLRGGAAYALTVHATFGGGNLQLQILAIDNTTWLNVGSTVTADGITTYSNLPPDPVSHCCHNGDRHLRRSDAYSSLGWGWCGEGP